jgi:hypothetical protein
MEKNYSGLKTMIGSEFFTIEMTIQYLLKYKDDKEVLKILVQKLRKYEKNSVFNYLIELVYFTLYNKCSEVDIFLLDLCAESFEFYSKITICFEIWGYQFIHQNDNYKKRVRNLLEDCETSMVNGEKCLINYNIKDIKNGNGAINFDQKELYEFVIGKRSKNDFKDDVRYFMNYLVKLSYLLIAEGNTDELKKIAVDYLHKLNLELYKRRSKYKETIPKYRFMYQGIIFPFEETPNSNLIVRIIYNETKIFKTKERCPFLVYFETVDIKDVDSYEPKWEKDIDYLRWQYNITIPESKTNINLQKTVEDMKTPQEREKKKFEKLKRYLAKEQQILHKNLKQSGIYNEDSEDVKKTNIIKYKSKSLQIERIRKRRRVPNDIMYVQKKMNKMSKNEIMKRMNFILLLIKHSKSKGLNKLNIEYLEKLKNMLGIFVNKNRKASLQKPTLLYEEKMEMLRKDSPFSDIPSLKIRGFIVKAGDDMRQESLIIHLINTISRILKRENCKIFIRELDFITLSRSTALIEYIPGSFSISSLKKKHPTLTLNEIFKQKFSNNFEEAQKNFILSLAGYSFVSYILQLKDRHNDNILIDSYGHIIHIDFGFCLNVSPGGISFETAPFKFTKDYIDIIGGLESPMFYFFKILLFKAFDVFKKFSEEFWNLLEIMKTSEISCFKNFDSTAFQERFHRFISDKEREQLVDDLIMNSFRSKRTTLYDQFQKYSNDIEL